MFQKHPERKGGGGAAASIGNVRLAPLHLGSPQPVHKWDRFVGCRMRASCMLTGVPRNLWIEQLLTWALTPPGLGSAAASASRALETHFTANWMTAEASSTAGLDASTPCAHCSVWPCCCCWGPLHSTPTAAAAAAALACGRSTTASRRDPGHGRTEQICRQAGSAAAGPRLAAAAAGATTADGRTTSISPSGACLAPPSAPTLG